MTTDQLRCFLTVADYLNFTRAAEALHVTHPAVSQQIRSLERELGTTLFERSTRSVRLTEAGHSFLGDARQMLEIAARARHRFDAGEAVTVETLSIAAGSYPALFSMADALTQLRAAHPAVHPRLHVVPFQHIYRRLADGDFDGVLGFRESSSATMGARFVELVCTPITCVCSASHPFATAETLSLDDLRSERLVLVAPPRVSPAIVELQGRLLTERRPSEIYFCESVEGMSVLAGAGYGVAVMPALLAPQLPEFVQIPLKGVEPVSFGLYHHDLEGKSVLRAFIQLLKKSLA